MALRGKTKLVGCGMVVTLISIVWITVILHSSTALMPKCPQFIGTQKLSRITFRLSADPGELRPDDERSVDGQQTFIWNIENNAGNMKGLEQVCEYTGTPVKTIQSVPGIVKRCMVDIKNELGRNPSISSRCE